jgi:hypothetical protein
VIAIDKSGVPDDAKAREKVSSVQEGSEPPERVAVKITS